MNCVRSKVLSGGAVVHGFGMAGFSLPDYLEGVFFQTNQMHGDRIVRLPLHSSRATLHEADAFITNEPGVICYVRTADCVPILLHDPVKRAVGAVHAGWRGTALNIVAKTVAQFEEQFGSRREDIRAAIGPSISGKCYEVGEDVLRNFTPKPRGKGFVDLQMINYGQLGGSGLSQIEIIPICNHCDERFASYRRDKNEKGRQVNFISLSQ